ncbi:hypothetical protein CEXT_240461 [Caerostris extrusa]|uniref:Uncharacterized protein n=1 Tax=Caerostris extrusa TaxID=172846 RepID=A0AAV4WGY7_CAEEX|nr:hypothetical protein CEXT_240461 [Caerostris extrusa]
MSQGHTFGTIGGNWMHSDMRHQEFPRRKCETRVLCEQKMPEEKKKRKRVGRRRRKKKTFRRSQEKLRTTRRKEKTHHRGGRMRKI